MIVQAELQFTVAAIGHDDYEVQRKLRKFHVVACSPSFVLLPISLCFTSRLCAAILEAEVDVSRKATMPTLAITLGYGRE